MVQKLLNPPISICLLVFNLLGCNQTIDYEAGANSQGHTAPTSATIKANKSMLEKRPFSNQSDFDNARKGLIAQDESLIIKQLNGDVVWDMNEYKFIDENGENSPDSVNPSLWRQAALNNIHGLFEVTKGIYQIRGYDLANMSIIESDNGWIIVDPLTSKETASKALLFAQKHLGKHPIKAILFTHSHMDHFGGVQGIMQHLGESEKQALRIIAPEGFEEEATSENIIAGTAMSRRAMYMYGKRLARNERGHVDTGLGKGPAFGSFGIESPSELIKETQTKLTIDGVPFIFQTVHGSEAPAEFTFYLPNHKAFCGAELVSNNMHNLYTLRGAKVRDAKIWSAYIDEARTLFPESEVYFASHHWPLWGNDKINDFLIKQRDTYKYIHDQSVRMMNEGLTPKEIAENLTLPASLNEDFHNQGYYGTIKHNAKAVYQRYLGWFTANPSKLDELPEPAVAKRYIEMMGGAEAVISKASRQFDEAASMNAKEGSDVYRWLAELLNHAVFADENNADAKKLLAKVYDQLAYQAESAPWRDFYLSGAYELRHGGPDKGISPAVMKEVLLKTPVAYFFDSMSVRLNGPKADGKKLNIKITFSDINESYLLMLENAVLRHKKIFQAVEADASLVLTSALFIDIIVGDANLKDVLLGDDLQVEGSKLDLISFFSLLGNPQGTFNIVTP
ncbi:MULTISPECIES: alkyl sulfatase dimerization domain-containing protein [unclassified Pseudoalteromonas]|jgi:alkyl sulfatase BDS1-like metallo-beta-lactamase superfamily hydrolase|uniref:alkyl/aryl-sulfatase n=1 Tax=unclassified Pseudoalteromonas TaxID=194690 RepID=UPI001E3258E2|nr:MULTISPECIES: alkyl sulfatase dimerization domain-containing protein [unclassified Pseudoalteromonas]MCC9662125.1 MBL fold metallo-hydrolase [Pseudoalteromonas sp. MB41]MCO7208617.1 MBL fold metallo-hydrolase [Pseudoalteromonas sp. CnMc7-37]